jgi:hypothetical protein
MPIVKSVPVKKYVNGQTVLVSEHTVVSEPEYKSDGEYVIVVETIDHCNLILDHTTTSHLVVKALTNVTLSPMEGQIDREWDDIEISKGACVELKYILHNWYILSSDGLKNS